MSRYLILDLSNNWNNAVAVVRLDNEYVQLLKGRLELAVSVKQKDPDFAWLEFFEQGSLEVYETDEDISAWIGEHTDAEEWSQQMWAITTEEPDFGSSVSLETDIVYLHVDEGCCFWETREKHGEDTLASQTVSAEAFENL